jgi:hypothetical protein
MPLLPDEVEFYSLDREDIAHPSPAQEHKLEELSDDSEA